MSELRHYSSLLPQLIPSLTDEFDIEVDVNFPTNEEQNKNPNEEIVRKPIIVRLLNEFWDTLGHQCKCRER